MPVELFYLVREFGEFRDHKLASERAWYQDNVGIDSSTIHHCCQNLVYNDRKCDWQNYNLNWSRFSFRFSMFPGPSLPKSCWSFWRPSISSLRRGSVLRNPVVHKALTLKKREKETDVIVGQIVLIHKRSGLSLARIWSVDSATQKVLPKGSLPWRCSRFPHFPPSSLWRCRTADLPRSRSNPFLCKCNKQGERWAFLDLFSGYREGPGKRREITTREREGGGKGNDQYSSWK